MSDSVLTLPTTSNSSYAASSLLVQAYVAPYVPGLQVEQGSEVRSSSSACYWRKAAVSACELVHTLTRTALPYGIA